MTIFDEDKKKKKQRSPFDSFFSDEDEIFGYFSRINEMMSKLFSSSLGSDPFEQLEKMKLHPGKPMVYGFSFKIGPDGKPIFEEFGNVESKKGPAGVETEIKPEREPMVDVQDKETEVEFIAELPGVSKHEIDIEVSEDGKTLSIDVPKKFHKKVQLKETVKSEVGSAHYNNGVQTIELMKKSPKKPASRGKRIKVE